MTFDDARECAAKAGQVAAGSRHSSLADLTAIRMNAERECLRGRGWVEGRR